MSILLGVAIAIVLAAVVSRFVAGSGGRAPRRASGGALRAELDRKLKGDERAAARLIELERRRRPDASEAELVRAAIVRLDRDRR
jgi:hypothetical protein